VKDGRERKTVGRIEVDAQERTAGGVGGSSYKEGKRKKIKKGLTHMHNMWGKSRVM